MPVWRNESPVMGQFNSRRNKPWLSGRRFHEPGLQHIEQGGVKMKRFMVFFIALVLVFGAVGFTGFATAAEQGKRVVVIDGVKYLVPDCCDAESLKCDMAKSDFLKGTMTPQDYVGGG